MLTHTLVANILYTDEITFRLAFTTTGDAANVGKLIAKDVAECRLSNNTMQPIFWNQQALDKYISATEPPVNAATAADTLMYKISTDASQDWGLPFTDNDKNNPLCTPPSDSQSQFACKQIKCIHDRNLDTMDFFDFQFKDAKTNNANDELIIALNDATVMINMYGRESAAKKPVHSLRSTAATTIKVYAGSLSNIAAAVSISAAALALNLF